MLIKVVMEWYDDDVYQCNLENWVPIILVDVFPGEEQDVDGVAQAMNVNR